MVSTYSYNYIHLRHSPSGEKKIYAQPELICIFINTPTFDQIEKDQRVKIDTQVGVIGGTMGLFTGFSILSGIEIIYYVIKLLASFRKRQSKQIVNSGKSNQFGKWQ